jgi:DNA polymerase-1
MQAFGLSRDTGLSRADSQKFIDMYWSRLPAVRRLFDETLRFGQRHGYVQTMYGRRRHIPELNAPIVARRMAAERMAINMPVQGTAADIMKIAMIRLAARLRDSGRKAHLLLQVHDELVLEVDRSDVRPVAALVRETMADAAELRVPLEVDVSIGENWEEMSPVAG